MIPLIYSRLLILSLEKLLYVKEIVISEIPFSHRKELQHLQTIGNSRLNADHAVNN